MNRFFVDEGNIVEEQNYIRIDNKNDRRHILKVLRLNIGDGIEISDGCSCEYITEIQEISESEIGLKILEKRKSATEPPIAVTLFQSIPKSDKMEIIIQKSVELGVSEIVPVMSQRTVIQMDSKNESKKVERWRKIALEAAKQCKRSIIPNVHIPIAFEQILDRISQYDLMIILYEKEKELGLKNLLKYKADCKKIAIIIGPEGGIAEEEILAAKKAGIVPVTLGPRILRTETAGFVALSIFMYEIGDLGGI